MVVLEPLRLSIINFDEIAETSVRVPDFPALEAASTHHHVAFGADIYIERDDYREVSFETQVLFIKISASRLRQKASDA